MTQQQKKLLDGLMERWDKLCDKSLDISLMLFKEKDEVKRKELDREWRENWLLESKVIKAIIPIINSIGAVKEQKPAQVLSLENYTNYTLPSEKITKEDILATF